MKNNTINQITVNQTLFVRREKDFLESLFNPLGSARGFFRKLKRGIKFYDLNRNLFAYLDANDPSRPLFVSARTQTDGRDSYMFSASDDALRLLGIDQVGYRKQRKIALATWQTLES